MAQQREWYYRISVDTLRGLGAFLLVVALGFFGYRAVVYFDDLYERTQSVRVLAEAEDLSAVLRGESGTQAFFEEYRAAGESIAAARQAVQQENFQGALLQAERARTLLGTIMRSVRLQAGAGEAQFVAVQGRVEFRRGERGDWQAARPRIPLHAGDYVKTAGSGSAEIMTLEGTLYTVRPDSVILVEPARVVGGGTERAITLDRGWVDLSTSRTASNISTPNADAQVQRESTAVVSYDDRRRIGRFAAYRGGMAIEGASGQSRELGTLEQVVQEGDQLSETRRLLPAPEPVEPLDNYVVAMEEVDRLVLSWVPVSGARRYALQVARNRLFSNNIIDVENRRGPRATLGIRGEGIFVWRVAAYGPEGIQGPWSQPRKFRIKSRTSAVG